MNEVATAYSDMIYFADQRTYEQWTAEQKKTHLTSMAISFTVSKNYGAITFEEKKKILEWDRFGHQRILTDKYLQCSLSDRHKVRIRADHTVEAEAAGGDQNGETLLHSCRNAQYVQACDGTTYIADQNGKVTEYGLAIHESDYRNWTDIISLSASEDILAGLHKNGTVSAAAASENLKTAVKKLNNIKQIACTEKEIIALDTAGHVFRCNEDGELSTLDIHGTAKQIAADNHIIYALLSDGTVFSTGTKEKPNTWRNILCIAACADVVAAVDSEGVLHTDTALFCGKKWDGMKLKFPEE